MIIHKKPKQKIRIYNLFQKKLDNTSDFSALQSTYKKQISCILEQKTNAYLIKAVFSIDSQFSGNMCKSTYMT